MANIVEPKLRYKYNPFREEVIEKLVTGKRFIFGSPKGDNTFAMVSRETGEDNGDITFGKCYEVEKMQFVKLYAEGVKMFLGLTAAGVKVFSLIFDRLIDTGMNADKIDLAYPLLTDEEKKNIAKTTFFRGINELCKANFLAPSTLAARYWINTNYIFRGDKITLVNQYRLMPTRAQEKQLEEGGQADDRGREETETSHDTSEPVS